MSLSPSQRATLTRGFELRVVVMDGDVLVFEHAVGGAQRFFDVAAAVGFRLALALGGLRKIAAGLDFGSAGLERFFGIEDEGEAARNPLR